MFSQCLAVSLEQLKARLKACARKNERSRTDAGFATTSLGGGGGGGWGGRALAGPRGVGSLGSI